MPRYLPRKGDLVTLAFRPEAGHEQHARHPALVVSNDLFNQATGRLPRRPNRPLRPVPRTAPGGRTRHRRRPLLTRRSAAEPAIPWREVVAMRHKLAHHTYDTALGILEATVHDDLPERAPQPFTPPCVSPLMMKRWKASASSTGGSTPITKPAASSRYSIANCPRNIDITTGIVRAAAVLVKSSA